MKQTKKELLYRYLLLFIGLAITAFGIAFSIQADLGTSPISSTPYVISRFTPFSVGNLTILLHCVFILLQIAILRKNYDPIQLMQLPVAFVFGYLNDFALFVLQDVTYHSYFGQWALCLIGILLVAIGVSFEVTANVVTLAGEGLVLAICKVTPIKFGYMKVIIDVSLVCIAVLLSLIFLKRVEGVREGTLAAAIFVGLLSKQINKPLQKMEQKYLIA